MHIHIETEEDRERIKKRKKIMPHHHKISLHHFEAPDPAKGLDASFPNPVSCFWKPTLSSVPTQCILNPGISAFCLGVIDPQTFSSYGNWVQRGALTSPGPTGSLCGSEAAHRRQRGKQERRGGVLRSPCGPLLVLSS